MKSGPEGGAPRGRIMMRRGGREDGKEGRGSGGVRPPAGYEFGALSSRRVEGGRGEGRVGVKIGISRFVGGIL